MHKHRLWMHFHSVRFSISIMCIIWCVFSFDFACSFRVLFRCLPVRFLHDIRTTETERRVAFYFFALRMLFSCCCCLDPFCFTQIITTDLSERKRTKTHRTLVSNGHLCSHAACIIISAACGSPFVCSLLESFFFTSVLAVVGLWSQLLAFCFRFNMIIFRNLLSNNTVSYVCMCVA